MSKLRVLLCTAASLFIAAGTLSAQGLTGQISGVIQDSSSGAMAGASVTLTNTGTNQAKVVTTDSSGNFVFAQLLASTYNLNVSAAGFKTYEQKDIVLASSERSALRAIVIEIGSVAESVSVSGDTAQLQTPVGAKRVGPVSTVAYVALAAWIVALAVVGLGYLATKVEQRYDDRSGWRK